MIPRPRRFRLTVLAALLLSALLPGIATSWAEGPPITDFLEIAASAQRACDAAAAGGRKGAFMADGTACFIGPITRESADGFLSLPIPDGAWLVLWSGGGDVASALDMAERILDRHMPVVVSRLCLSSCANYLFVAGAAKVVMPESVVAWHGGPSKELPSKLTEQGRIVYARTLARQDAFFRRVGVDDRLIYEPRPGSGVTAENRATHLWGWGADDLQKRFGMRGIL